MPPVADHFLDDVPIVWVFILMCLIALAFYEGGFRLGRWWQIRTPDEKSGSTGMLVGSQLALLAFLVAFAIGMASSRFESRNALVLQEANAIGTVYLRAGLLPTPYDAEAQSLLREYAPLRINVRERDTQEAQYARTIAIQQQLWASTELMARRDDDSTILALYVEALNVMIDTQNERLVVGVYARVPETVLIVLVIAGALTVGMVGYNAGLSGIRSLFSAVMLILLTAIVITLVLDLDRPTDGLLKTNQQALLDLQDWLGSRQE